MSVKIVSPREMIIEAINLFESVGMQRAGVTRITFAMYDPEKPRELIGGGKKTGKYFEDKSPAWLRRWLPEIISDCNTRQESVIINHPEGDGVTLFQCDDISEDALRRVQHLAFIVFCTSPGSYQAWFCVPSQDEESDKDFKGRCKRGNADMSATGSTRVVGSTNFKDKYGPGYPTITISHAAPGRRTTREGLAEALGVDLAAEEPKPLPAPVSLYSAARSGRSGNRWPDYARCHRGSSDPSGSDFTWCRQAFGWGWGYSIDDVANELMRLVPEDRLRRKGGWRYCHLTASEAYVRGRWDRAGWDRYVTLKKAISAPQNERRASPRSATPPAHLPRSEDLAQSSSSPSRPAQPGIPSAFPSSPSKAKAKIIALTESEVDARAIESASGITTIAVGRGIPSDLRVRCGLGRVLMVVSDASAQRLKSLLWGKLVRVHLPNGVGSASDMDVTALRDLILQLASEVALPPAGGGESD